MSSFSKTVKVGKVVIATKIFHDPSYCNNRQDLRDPHGRDLHEQLEIFLNDPSNNVVNWEKHKFTQMSPSTWMLVYERFVEDKIA